MPLMLSAINGNFIWCDISRQAKRVAVHECHCEILLPRFLHILIFDNCRFGGSFPAQRVKTAISFFTTFAISFPVGSLGEEFGWRGVMAPYITLLLDRRFGAGRTWKWTPLLQSLLTGIIWAVRGFLSLHWILCCCCHVADYLSSTMMQVWHVPVFYVDAASQRKCNFWQFLMQEPM